MTIWLLLALMTVAAVFAVIWPLARRDEVVAEAAGETAFYQDQVREIDRDRERGLISPSEAEAAKAEAARRLLRAASAGARPGTSPPVGEPALRRRRAVSAFALSTVPLLAVAVYGAYGSPNLAGQPLAGREAPADPSRFDLATAVARIEAHLVANPNDGQGWEVIAPVYLRGGRVEDAVRAYANAVRLLEPTADRLASYGEALVTARDGVVSAEARTVFERALKATPKHPKAAYYLALAAEQDGRTADARAAYAALLSDASPDAPWRPLVSERLARLQGGAAQATATLPANERQAAIQGMVEGLAARLESGGGSAEEWSRLVRSYVVLGEREKALGALARARQALTQDAGAVARVETTARDLGLDIAP